MKTFNDLVEAIDNTNLKDYLGKLKGRLSSKGYEVGFGDCTSSESCSLDEIPDNPAKDDYLLTVSKFDGDEDPKSFWVMGDLGFTNVVYRAYPTEMLFRLTGNVSSDVNEISHWMEKSGGLKEGADYGRSRFTSVEDAEIIGEVYDYVKNSLKNLGNVYGSTTDDSHGYIAVSTAGVSVDGSIVDEFREMFPNIEFKITEKERNCVSFRTKGSKGWW